MYYQEDFTKKCNTSNCNGIVSAYYAAADNKDIIVKCYNEKKKQQYSLVIDMSEVTKGKNIELNYIYIKLEDYQRYSYKKNIELVNFWEKFINVCIKKYLKEYNLYPACARAPHLIKYTDMTKAKSKTVYYDWTYYEHMEL